MDFSIKPHKSVKGNLIYVPIKLQEELGILEGQYIKISGTKDLVLEVKFLKEQDKPFAFISEKNFDDLGHNSLDFELLDITLGCDPEFFILWGTRFISAATYLPGHGEIGCDGSLGELRPMYGSHEQDVVTNLKKLIAQIPDKASPARWAKWLPRSGAALNYQAHSYFMERAAGFHIHLGVPPELIHTQRSFHQVAVNYLIRCLDYYVSVPTVPLEKNHRRRLGKGKFGKPGDYRYSNLTLEYRTPGAFFLRTPVLAAGILGIALAITETMVSRLKVVSHEFVRLNKLTGKDLQEILTSGEPTSVYGMLTTANTLPARRESVKIHKLLEELPTYKKHEQSIEAFFKEVDKGSSSGASPNLLTNWKG